LQDIISRIRYVFPLYSEEVHLVTTKGSGITGLRDLAGKAVAVGNLESGTYLTASFILLLSKVVVKPVEIDQTEALQRLLLPAGNPARVDALFYVAGTPVPLFADDPSLRRRLAAVPIVEPAVLQKYSPAQFTSRDYGWVADKVDTVRVRSVLMSFDFRRDQCANVGMVANRIKKHLPELQGGLGHPKWAEVDIAAPLPGWQAYDCVAQYIDAHVGPRGGRRCAFINAPASVGATPPSTASDDPFCVSGKENNNPIVQNLCSNLNKLPQ
jgi:uncharacterized protein